MNTKSVTGFTVDWIGLYGTGGVLIIPYFIWLLTVYFSFFYLCFVEVAANSNHLVPANANSN